MLRRWLTHLRLCFCTQTSEKLRRHHLRGALNHSLAHARDRSANLNVAGVVHLRAVLGLLEIQIAGTFEKSRRAFAFDDDAEVFGLSQVFEPSRCR